MADSKPRDDDYVREHYRKMEHHAKQLAAATLAAAMIMRRSNPTSIKDAENCYNEAFYILHPERGNSRYEAWLKQDHTKPL